MTDPKPAARAGASLSKNALYTAEYFAIADALGGDIAGRRAARAYMTNSTAIVHHAVVDSTFIPRLFDQATYEAMKRIAENAHRILCKVINRYLDDPSYRSVFDFDPRLTDLILLPRGYDALLPFARVDTFLDEETLTARFCEFNADGSSGMNENREITRSLRGTATFEEFARRHDVRGCELFESWVDEFAAIYATFDARVNNPTFAICDYLDHGVVDEFHLFADLFRARGIECIVADVRELRFNGRYLADGQGRRIDAIWRRSVTNDLLTYWSESLDLIRALRAQKVALIGSFAGHIVHDKQIFRVLHDPATAEFLTADENTFVRETVPHTAFLDESHLDLADVRARKDAWIIKPTDRYGADDVYAGCSVDQRQWEALVERFANGAAGCPFIAQTYIQPFKTDTLPPDTGIELLADNEVPRQPLSYNNINGLYLYNGRFQGVFSRLGPLPTISKDMKGITAATLWVDVKGPEREGASPHHEAQA